VGEEGEGNVNPRARIMATALRNVDVYRPLTIFEWKTVPFLTNLINLGQRRTRGKVGCDPGDWAAKKERGNKRHQQNITAGSTSIASGRQ